MPLLDVLPQPQRLVWAELSQIPSTFTLYGGTAIALCLGHRQSIDFDFFGTHSFSPIDLAGGLRLLEGGTVLQSEPNTLVVSIDRGGPVKMSFFGVPRLKRLRPARICEDNKLQVAAMLDLAGSKAKVVQQRAEAKDYIDIDAILQAGEVSLPMALSAARAMYGAVFTPQSTLKALTYFGEPQLRELPEGLKQRLLDAVRAVDLDHLPNVLEEAP